MKRYSVICLLVAAVFVLTAFDKKECDAPSNAVKQSACSTTVMRCVKPPYLKRGDKVALISPSYYVEMEYVEKAADVLRGWGLIPVIGPNVGKQFAGKYAGTLSERVSDLRWALRDTSIKAIICNRGGYGSIDIIDQLSLREWGVQPKWIVGYSDITTIHGLLTRAGVMSIHGTMSKSLADGGNDDNSILLRDLLMGNVPQYQLPSHPQNIKGRASGILVGGNLCTFVPNLGTQADATLGKDIILFVEEVQESMHNIDRQFKVLAMNGVLDRCKGIILGEFTDCGTEFTYGSVEEMLQPLLERYNIPVMCGFPGGHGDINLPLVMGSKVIMDVRNDGATLIFNIDGPQRAFSTNCGEEADY